MKYIKKLYKLERHARKNDFTVEEIYHMRQTESKPILEDFKKWLSKKSLQTPPKSLLGKAVPAVTSQLSPMANILFWYKTAPQKAMLQKTGQPFTVGYVSLTAGDILYVTCIDQNNFQVMFKNIMHRPPVNTGTLHSNYGTIIGGS